MADLRSTYDEWRDREFPPGSSCNSLDELHADLALADTWVAESVIPYIDHGRYLPAKVDVPVVLRTLVARAEALERSRPDVARVAADYADYARLLERVYNAFLSESPARD
jgi:hypothetical protein